MSQKFRVYDNKNKCYADIVNNAVEGELLQFFVNMDGELFVRAIEGGHIRFIHESALDNRYKVEWL